MHLDAGIVATTQGSLLLLNILYASGGVFQDNSLPRAIASELYEKRPGPSADPPGKGPLVGSNSVSAGLARPAADDRMSGGAGKDIPAVHC